MAELEKTYKPSHHKKGRIDETKSLEDEVRSDQERKNLFAYFQFLVNAFK